MDYLNIQDIDKLKITSVKHWAVNFRYDGQEYFLHDDSDEDRCIGLYHKTPEGNNRIVGVITLFYPSDFIISVTGKVPKYNRQEKLVTPLSQINKKYFVYALTEQGLAKSLYSDIVQEKNNQAKEAKGRIEYLQFQIDFLKKDMNAIKQPPSFIFEKDPYIPKEDHKNKAQNKNLNVERKDD